MPSRTSTYREIVLEQQAIEQTQHQHERQSIRRRIGNTLEMHDSKTAQSMGRVMNLSAEGFMLLTKQEINPNERHDFVLQLPQAVGVHRSIELVVECRWCQPSNTAGYFGAGFSLVSVPITKREAWKRFVEEY